MVVDKLLFLTLTFTVLLVGGWLFFVSQNARNTRRQIHQIAEQHTLIHADERARELCMAIHQLHPMMHAGVDFMIKRDGTDNAPYIAEWNASTPKPSREQLDTAFSKVAGKNYVDLRKAEYPSVGDQLDAAYKARHGDNSEQIRQDTRIADIKMKYPKSGTCE
jgi:hypothetical protein